MQDTKTSARRVRENPDLMKLIKSFDPITHKLQTHSIGDLRSLALLLAIQLSQTDVHDAEIAKQLVCGKW